MMNKFLLDLREDIISLHFREKNNFKHLLKGYNGIELSGEQLCHCGALTGPMVMHLLPTLKEEEILHDDATGTKPVWHFPA